MSVALAYCCCAALASVVVNGGPIWEFPKIGDPDIVP